MFNVPRHVKSPENIDPSMSDGITAPLLQRSSTKPQRRMDEVVTKGHVVELPPPPQEERNCFGRPMRAAAAAGELSRHVVRRSVFFMG